MSSPLVVGRAYDLYLDDFADDVMARISAPGSDVSLKGLVYTGELGGRWIFEQRESVAEDGITRARPLYIKDEHVLLVVESIDQPAELEAQGRGRPPRAAEAASE